MSRVTLDELPEHLLLAQLCGFVHLQDRWHGLARVSRRWRRLALASVHRERHVDLTWCTGEHELEAAAAALLYARGSRHSNNKTLDASPSQLQSVALYGPRVTPPLLSHLVKGLGCNQLKHVEVESKQISDAALAQLCRCSGLRSLALHCIKLTDSALLSISRSCPQLNRVDLSGCSRVRDDGVLALVAHCPELERLDLTMCRRISDRAVVALAQHASLSLREVVLDRCLKVSGPALRFLVRMQRNLRALSFARCPKVLGADFYDLEQFLSGPKDVCGATCELSTLDLAGCASLDDRGVAALVSANRHTLRDLDLSALPGIGSATFAAVARCDQLQTLNLSLCRSLQNADLAIIATGCTQLSTLLLRGCVAIDDAGLQTFAPHGKTITRLSLEFCYGVSDVGLAAVATHCSLLVHLNVKACNQLTIAAFQRLARRSRPLETLYIGACADMETTAVYFALVKQAFPRCRIHWV